MKHLLIILTLTCCSHASAEKATVMTSEEASDIISDLTSQAALQSATLSSQTLEVLNHLKSNFAVYCNSASSHLLFLVNNYQKISSLIVENEFFIKRMTSSDYNKSVLMKLMHLDKTRLKDNFQYKLTLHELLYGS